MSNLRQTLICLGLSQLLVSCGLFRDGDDVFENPTNNAARVQENRRTEVPRTPASLRNGFADGMAATVNGKVVTRSEVRGTVSREAFLLQQQVLSPSERKKRLSQLEKEGLDALIDRKLILAEYNKRGYPVRAKDVDTQINYRVREQFGGDRNKFVEALRQAGITMRKFRSDQEDTIKILRMKQAIAQDKTRTPSTQEVQSYYNENINDYRDEGTVSMRTLTIPKQDRRDPMASPKSQRLLAQDIHRQLKRGSNFATLAKKYSRDSAARDGGNRGIIDKQTLQPLLTMNAYNLKAGETSEIIEDQRNYYILKVDSRQYGKAQPLSEVQEGIEKTLVAGQKEKVVETWVASLRERALINTY
ncbi:peptidyl-prolyl cis-trans isomerase [bacterium]|jgi:parvulin-like peptidyl-prolyl isomerase|nr:peptidyl-prolyl cis-trans isomerase [Verrucomicrobiales bacterium]MDB2346391.1 peptidyl-prolyl cis-trans isomerase [Verrucomicrobiales bacterium]MDC3254984.1 peptidyl-prolyl cis-trans isomerase [bacterium]MDF1785182.1 peptidyl-prolyl cis-trans isomerase [Verrucomicrobiales bacterium]